MKKPSTKPKGATSYKETVFGTMSHAKLLTLELEGTKKGLELISDIVLKNPHIEISPQLILDIHGKSFAWIFPDWAGKYRTIRVEFSGKEPVLPHQIPELMTNLCADLKVRLSHLQTKEENYIEKVVELLSWFQHRLVWIHPFQDYNGRVARMLTVLILLSLNLPPIEIKANTGWDRKIYLKAMYSADEGDYSRLEKLISKALNESLTHSSNNL